jgi:hypothetical protein
MASASTGPPTASKNRAAAALADNVPRNYNEHVAQLACDHRGCSHNHIRKVYSEEADEDRICVANRRFISAFAIYRPYGNDGLYFAYSGIEHRLAYVLSGLDIQPDWRAN